MKKTPAKTLIYVGAALLTLTAHAAFAETAAEWTGPYIGGNFGYGWGDFHHDDGVAGPSGHEDTLLGGADIGQNFQFTNRIVIGAEADADAFNINTVNPNSTFREDWMSTVRARAGYAFDQFLPYFTAGVGMTNTIMKAPNQGSNDNVDVGAAVGGGLDFMLSDSADTPSPWFARVEYLYVDVPRYDTNVSSTSVAGGTGNNLIRVGLNYMF